MRGKIILWLNFLAAAIALAPFSVAQEKPAGHAHHGAFMQGGMHHAVAKGVTLASKVDANAHSVTLRVGPMDLPANTDHMHTPQPPDLIGAAPFEGCLLGYRQRL